jgi:large subunit ribosomal protein L13
MILDATDLIVGRLGTVIAKRALLGEGIVIVNSEKAVISGKKPHIFSEAKRKSDMGTPAKGPFIPRSPDRYLKRMIRGMLPYKQPKGSAAYKRIKCYIGIPPNFMDQKRETIEDANCSKLPQGMYVTIKEVCKHLGGK